MTTSADTHICCFKFRVKTESKGVEQVVLKNGRDAVSATCVVCETRKFRMGKLA